MRADGLSFSASIDLEPDQHLIGGHILAWCNACGDVAFAYTVNDGRDVMTFCRDLKHNPGCIVLAGGEIISPPPADKSI